MTISVHSCLAFSVGYAGVGTACLHNAILIIVLRLPETDLLSTRGHPRAALSMRSYTR
jgi:hypothetical protein